MLGFKLPSAIVCSLIATYLLACGVAQAQLVFGERTYEYEPSDVLPDAAEFRRQDSYWEAYGPGGGDAAPLLGYVLLTDDLVEIPAYSGHTINTLVGIDLEGRITGVKIIQHSEPIVLIGLDEQVIHDFVAQYVGKDIRDRIIISNRETEGYVVVDGISSATVTAVAENATILEAGRRVARSVGIVQAFQIRKQLPSARFEPLTWQALLSKGALGQVVVQAADLGRASEDPAIDLRFAILDPPVIGKNLLGERFFEIVADRLREQGGSALFIGANGTASFKGAGFARGGIFDRFSLAQGDELFVFQDVDYFPFVDLAPEDSPSLGEGGVFFIPSGRFDPTAEFTFHLTLPYRIDDRKTYSTFLQDYELPAEFVEKEVPFWMTRWQQRAPVIVGFVCFLAFVALLFSFRQHFLRFRKPVRYSVAIVAIAVIGIALKAQPSTTQILTLANSAVHLRFPIEIFLSEPMIFLFWIVIPVSLAVWGRGFFCGWLCPYGALLELLCALWRKVAPKGLTERIDAWEPGRVWKSGKYVAFLVLLGVGLFNLVAAEMLAEVEPFKTFILGLTRPLHFVLYFVSVTLISAVVYRFFCRVLCPLGGALAIPSRRPLHALIRYESCASCKICYRGCEPKAISPSTGRIDYSECLQCWDCQQTGQRVDLCPELITAGRQQTSPRLMLGVLFAGLVLIAPAAGWAKTWAVAAVAGAAEEVIAASSEGDTLLLEPGVHIGPLVVSKPLLVRGEPGAVVDARGKGHVVVIDAPGVTVEGLTLRGCRVDQELSDAGIKVAQHASDATLRGNRISGCRFGIWVHGSQRASMVGNAIEGIADLEQNSRGDCIHLWSTKHAEIRDNSLSTCRDGVYMELSSNTSLTGNTIEQSRYSVHSMWCDRSAYNENVAIGNYVGLAIMFSKGIEAKGNTLHDNLTHGILLTQVTRAVVSGNIIVGNTKGIFVYNSLYNVVRDNFIARNNLGMHYWAGSEENELVGNTFLGNEIQVKFIASHDQEWNGNFWSDYTGWDVDGDGHGDAAYRSNSLVDALLWNVPLAKLLLASPAFQVLAAAERQFPVISVPKGIDRSPLMRPGTSDWEAILERYPSKPQSYYGSMAKLPHLPGER